MKGFRYQSVPLRIPREHRSQCYGKNTIDVSIQRRWERLREFLIGLDLTSIHIPTSDPEVEIEFGIDLHQHLCTDFDTRKTRFQGARMLEIHARSLLVGVPVEGKYCSNDVRR